MTGPLFPENYSKIWIRGRFITMAGVAVRGKLTLAPTVTGGGLVNRSLKLIMSTASFSADTDNDGYVALQVPATNDPDITPVNFTYSVTTPIGQKFSIVVPYDTTPLNSVGDPLHGQPVIELIDMVPVGSSGGVGQLLRGIGIQSMVDNGAGGLLITYTDLSTTTVAMPDTVAGPPGPIGPEGPLGPVGPAGPTGDVSAAQLSAAVAAVKLADRPDVTATGAAVDGPLVASQVDGSGNMTAAKVGKPYPPVTDPTSSLAQRGAATVALTGHSLMYGQDTTGTGTTAATNGATQTRSARPTTDQFAAAAALNSPTAITVVNQGYPGDRTTEALTRWVAGQSGAVEFFWLDVNDANNYGGLAGGTLTDAQTATNLRNLIRRARERGADVVVVGGSPDSTSEAASRAVYASAQTDRTIAERMGARYVDAGELLAAVPRSVGLFSGGPHLTAEGYTAVGARLAALLGPKGVNPPKVGPGRIITPRDRLHVGGAIASRGGAADGSVIRLTVGQSVSIPVDVTAPCVPLVRVRQETANGVGVAALSWALGGAGRATRYFTTHPIQFTGAGYTWLPGVELASPGPDAIVVKAESGFIEIDSITFVPLDLASSFVTGDTVGSRRARSLRLHPVGGKAAFREGDASWSSMIDIGSAVSIRSGADQATKVNTKWAFEMTVGASNSGMLLAAAALTSSVYLVRAGYMVIRNGTSMIVREFDNGTTTDTTTAGIFASATGTARVGIEIDYDATADTLSVFVDGVAGPVVTTPKWTTFMSGLLAGTTAGGGYASGAGMVYQ